MNRLADALAPLGLMLLLLGAWEAACRLTGVPAYFLPPPSQVAVAAATGLPVLVPAAWNRVRASPDSRRGSGPGPISGSSSTTAPSGPAAKVR